jgi:hypothetical protein
MKRIALSLAVVVFPAFAAADLPPPDGYVEQCTVEKQCAKGEEGTACRASFKERDKCRTELSAQGWVHKCKTRGASVWTEVWCRPKKADDKAPKK